MDFESLFKNKSHVTAVEIADFFQTNLKNYKDLEEDDDAYCDQFADLALAIVKFAKQSLDEYKNKEIPFHPQDSLSGVNPGISIKAHFFESCMRGILSNPVYAQGNHSEADKIRIALEYTEMMMAVI